MPNTKTGAKSSAKKSTKRGAAGSNGRASQVPAGDGNVAGVEMILPVWLQGGRVTTEDPAMLAGVIGAIDESLGIFRERLGELETVSEAQWREQTDSLLVMLYSRFNNLISVPTPVYNRYGYLDTIHTVQHKLARLASANSVASANPRLDNILEALFHEARSLAEAQITECPHCEHCERKGTLKPSEPDPRVLDERRLTYAIEGIAEAASSFDRYGTFAFAEHIIGLAHEERYGAIRLACEQLIEVLSEETRDSKKQRVAEFIEARREDFARCVAIDLDHVPSEDFN